LATLQDVVCALQAAALTACSAPPRVKLLLVAMMLLFLMLLFAVLQGLGHGLAASGIYFSSRLLTCVKSNLTLLLCFDCPFLQE
jgi:hypothetical protein